MRPLEEWEADVRFPANQERIEGVYVEETRIYYGRSQEQSVDSLYHCELLSVWKREEPSNGFLVG